ncbi:MAG: PBS lyase [Spirochaetales bacterium]|nr:PBS lyase [Spirochaetales bacterium]MCF7937287.1 PBS lyase [Spirochaetales bacterium]
MQKTIKRTLLILLLVSMTGPSLFAIGEVSAVWSRIYRRANTLQQKHQVMQSIVEQHSREMVPVLSQALEEQLQNLSNPMNTKTRNISTSLLKIIVKELGRLKASETAPLVFELVQASDDPLLKGEAILSLGKMRARGYAEDFALMLRNLNMNYGDIQQQRANETLAYSLVLALELLKDPVGYSPVFFAASGWYSDVGNVKQAAERALKTMVDDPTDQLTNILLEAKDISVKKRALEAAVESDASSQNKVELASLALAEGLNREANSAAQRRELKQLRLDSLRILAEAAIPDESALVSFDEMIYQYRVDRVFDEDEMLTAIHTMGNYKDSEEAAEILSRFLEYMNNQREAGKQPDSLRIAKATVIALGEIGSPVATEQLMTLTFIPNWENSIIRLAKESLEKIQ